MNALLDAFRTLISEATMARATLREYAPSRLTGDLSNAIVAAAEALTEAEERRARLPSETEIRATLANPRAWEALGDVFSQHLLFAAQSHGQALRAAALTGDMTALRPFVDDIDRARNALCDELAARLYASIGMAHEPESSEAVRELVSAAEALRSTVAGIVPRLREYHSQDKRDVAAALAILDAAIDRVRGGGR